MTLLYKLAFGTACISVILISLSSTSELPFLPSFLIEPLDHLLLRSVFLNSSGEFYGI